MCTPVLVHPRNPELELSETHSALTRELTAQRCRIVPEDELDPVPHVKNSDLAVILLGARFDETVLRLVRSLKDNDKPFVIWPSPALEKTNDLTQRGFFQDVVAMKCTRGTLLSPAIDPHRLKQEALALLCPQTKIPSSGEGGKPRIYLIYDSDRNSEIDHAGKIAYHYKDDFQFEHSDNPRQHSSRLTQSEGVLLVWGEAGEEWCAAEFEQMVRLSRIPQSRGLCLFDPKQSKTLLADQIRSNFPDPPIYIAQQFGTFDPARMEPFFNPLRNSRTRGSEAEV